MDREKPSSEESEEDMTKYLIRESQHSSDLIEAKNLELIKLIEQRDDPDDPSKVVKEFEAVCWCAAKKVYAEHRGYEAPDMSFCDTDAREDVGSLCPHYKEVKAGEI